MRHSFKPKCSFRNRTILLSCENSGEWGCSISLPFSAISACQCSNVPRADAILPRRAHRSTISESCISPASVVNSWTFSGQRALFFIARTAA